jgi:tetratricopeptide (TPR) repeat protein
MSFSRWHVLSFSYYVLLGGLLGGIGWHRSAEFVYRKGLTYSKQSGSMVFANLFLSCIADTLYSQGQEQAALKLLRDQVESCPDSPRAHHDLARLYLRCNESSRAIEHFEKALHLEKDHEWRDKISSELSHLRQIRNNPSS